MQPIHKHFDWALFYCSMLRFNVLPFLLLSLFSNHSSHYPHLPLSCSHFYPQFHPTQNHSHENWSLCCFHPQSSNHSIDHIWTRSLQSRILQFSSMIIHKGLYKFKYENHFSVLLLQLYWTSPLWYIIRPLLIINFIWFKFISFYSTSPFCSICTIYYNVAAFWAF